MRALSLLHQKFELCGTRESSRKHYQLVTLGSYRSLDGLEKVKPLRPLKEIVEVPGLVVRGTCAVCAHLAQTGKEQL